MPRVHHQRRMRLQELRLELLAVAKRSQVALDLVNRKELHPLLVLRLIRGDLRVERFGDAPDRDAVLRLDHELLLQPQLLLEVLELGEEVDDLACDLADDLDLGQILLDARRGLVLHVVQVHDFVLDVEVHLPAEKGPEVLVDEVVEGVARSVALEVRLQSRVVGPLAARPDVRLGQLGDPLRQRGVGHGQDVLGSECAQVLLDRGPLPSVAFVLGPVGERRRAVLEADDELLALPAVLLGDEVMA